jgi:sporulation integral membrane protein YlbJ
MIILSSWFDLCTEFVMGGIRLKGSKFHTVILAASALFLTTAILIFPEASVEASKSGLKLWWEIVFPSLLPFFILSEILIGFGVVTFIGVLLEPIMRPLFRVPGEGGFVWAMGMASGFPAGAKLTARLRQEKQLSAIEAERLVSFTNSSNPLFIFGAVAVGFFQNQHLGYILALSHYLGNFFVGIMMRFHGGKQTETEQNNRIPSLKKALQMMHETRLKDRRPLGKLLGDAVQTSIQSLLMIGGFIILFSVLNKMLSMLQFTAWIAPCFDYVLALLHLPAELSQPLISGLFEITLGSQKASQAEHASLLEKAVITSFILAFNGISIQAQVAGILADTDIRFKPFFVARIFHGFFSGVICFLLWKPVYVQTIDLEKILPAFLYKNSSDMMIHYFSLLKSVGPPITIFTLAAYVVILFARMKKEMKN